MLSAKQDKIISDLEDKIHRLEVEDEVVNEVLWQILTHLSHGNVAQASRIVSDAVDRRQLLKG